MADPRAIVLLEIPPELEAMLKEIGEHVGKERIEDLAVRCEALRLLLAEGGLPFFQAAVALIQNQETDSKVKQILMLALGTQKDKRAKTLLIPLLQDEKDETLLQTLVDALTYGSPDDPSTEEEIARIIDEARFELEVELLPDTLIPTREEIIAKEWFHFFLGCLPNRYDFDPEYTKALEKLFSSLENQKAFTANARISATQSLISYTFSEEIAQAFLSLAKRPGLRSAGSWALLYLDGYSRETGLLRQEYHETLLEIARRPSDPFMTAVACRSLWGFYDADTLDTLSTVAKNTDSPRVCENAVTTLMLCAKRVSMVETEALDALEYAARKNGEEWEQVRAQAMQGLLSCLDAEAFYRARAVLRETNDDTCERIFLQFLPDRIGGERRAGTTTLATSADVFPYLTDTDEGVRYYAIESAEYLRDPIFLNILAALAANDPDDRVRARAAHAFRSISEGK